MKNNTVLKLFIIIMLALIFRVWFLDKPEGLWFDEYVSWNIASQKSFSNFIHMVLQNPHTPLYYLYLKLWMFIFADTDLALRWSSVIPSILGVFVMYFLGKEFHSKSLGLFCALFTAISSFCIYFAQEVRLYSLIFLFTSLIVLFFIKSAKNPSKKNLCLFFLFNALLCALHTLGIIFSVCIITSMFVYFRVNNGNITADIKKITSIFTYILPFIIVLLILLPFLYSTASSKTLSQFWGSFSPVKVLCLFTDYFSPVQTNIVNTAQSFYSYILHDGKFNFSFIIFAIIPAIIGVFFTIKSFFCENKIIKYLLYTAVVFLTVIIIISLTGRMVLITKYTTEIYPILILAFASGIFDFKNKKAGVIIALIFILINIFYLIIADNSAPKLHRSEGHRAVIELLRHSRLKTSDFVILTYYGQDKFEKYLDNKTRYNFYSINKYNFNDILFNDDYYNVLSYGKSKYKDVFAQEDNPQINKYVDNNIISKMKKGDRVGIVILENVSFLSKDTIKEILSDSKKYEMTPLIFLVFSSLRINLLQECKTKLKLDTLTHSGDWTLYVYEKV